jgi:hypothetical protein
LMCLRIVIRRQCVSPTSGGQNRLGVLRYDDGRGVAHAGSTVGSVPPSRSPTLLATVSARLRLGCDTVGVSVTECYSVRADVHPRKLGRAGPTAARPSASCTGRVEYRVVGSARHIDITMENRQNNTEQRDDVPVPFRTSGGTMDCGDFIYISVQNQGSSGTVTCEMFVDGVKVGSATSSGECVIACCSGGVPR